jgi:5'-methylthioinosine phosphorylase
VKTIGIIGGTGALALAASASATGRAPSTPFGEASSPILRWGTPGASIRFIARHGLDASIPPHLVNYRANIWALHEESPDYVVGINAVGGIANWASPARLVFPDQIIDYTWGRAHTFFDGETQPLRHAEFADPLSAAARSTLLRRAGALQLDFHPDGTYGATQGPRLETAAEIRRLERDGCDIVGMTAMPEAALAREVDIDFAICAVVVNWAAGKGPEQGGIHAEIGRNLDAGMAQATALLSGV